MTHAEMRDATLAALAEHWRVNVFVDARHPSVILPKHLQGAADPVHLHIGLALPIPIRDLNVDVDGITGTFSFGGRPCLVVLPWDYVLYVGSDEQLANLRGTKPQTGPRQAPRPAPKPRRALPPGWRVIEGGRGKTAPQGTDAA